MLKVNESLLDRIIRAVLALILIVVGIFFTSGVLQIVLIVVGGILALTAITGFCLLYSIFGICTLKEKKQ
ncbi:MAG: YgaP family membrane protein [Brevinematia bacterium]